MSHSLNFTVLKALRKQKGITLHDISESTGISPTTLCGIENNNGNPNLETLAKLADALEITLSSLIALAEQGEPAKRKLGEISHGEFHFRTAEIRDIQFYWGEAPAQESVAFPTEIHECDHEACIVLKGSMRFIIDGKPYIVNPGEVLEFNNNFEHTCHAVEDSEVIAIHFKT